MKFQKNLDIIKGLRQYCTFDTRDKNKLQNTDNKKFKTTKDFNEEIYTVFPPQTLKEQWEILNFRG